MSSSRKQEQRRQAFWLAAASQWSLFICKNTQKNTVHLRENNQKDCILAWPYLTRRNSFLSDEEYYTILLVEAWRVRYQLLVVADKERVCLPSKCPTQAQSVTYVGLVTCWQYVCQPMTVVAIQQWDKDDEECELQQYLISIYEVWSLLQRTYQSMQHMQDSWCKELRKKSFPIQKIHHGKIQENRPQYFRQNVP